MLYTVNLQVITVETYGLPGEMITARKIHYVYDAMAHDGDDTIYLGVFLVFFLAINPPRVADCPTWPGARNPIRLGAYRNNKN